MGAAAASGHIQIMRYLAFTQVCIDRCTDVGRAMYMYRQSSEVCRRLSMFHAVACMSLPTLDVVSRGGGGLHLLCPCFIVLSCAVLQGCKVTEIRDMTSLWSALEKCLYDGANVVPEVRVRNILFAAVLL